MKRKTVLNLMILLLFSAVSVCPLHAAVLERTTGQGPVTGVLGNATKTISWKAVPYARPPVGSLRWKAPEPPEKRSQSLSADTFCDICPQYVNHDRDPKTPQIVVGNEDCLYLNIWAPEDAGPKAGLPVFFWIHGGGNSIQWPLLSMLDGGVLAGKGKMVVVTVNYRLGPMGFLSHPALKTGDAAGDSGNFALLDQIAALKWVKANIEAFGGDPQNVTIAGESAGGQNVFCLLASPLAKGLFHRAIAQSGVIRPSTPETGAAHVAHLLEQLLVKDGKAADAQAAKAIAEKMDGPKIGQYLRAKPAKAFLDLYPMGPVMGMIRFPTAFSDGHVLPADFYGALRSGNYNKVPVILGSNKEETKLFTRTVPPFGQWREDQSLFKDPAKMAFWNTVTAYQSDGWKAMAVDEPARIMTANSGQPPVFAYQFLWGAGGLKNSVMAVPYNLLLGACHAMEIDFVFGTEKASLGALVFTDKNRPGRVALSSAMMAYWARFAKTGDPNPEGGGLPRWQSWTNGTGPKSLLLDATVDAVKIAMSNEEVTNQTIEAALEADPLRDKVRPYWDKSPYRRH